MRLYSRFCLMMIFALGSQYPAFAEQDMAPASQPAMGKVDSEIKNKETGAVTSGTGLIFVDPATRLYYIAHSGLMTKVNVDDLDAAQMAAGPQFLDNRTLPNDSKIDCDYLPDDLGGTTEKFKCKINKVTDPQGNIVKTKLKHVKVRYNSIKPYTDVVTTRFAWALGFGHDSETPIQEVVCHHCTCDPFKQHAPVAGDCTFTATSVEDHMDGTGIADPKAKYSHAKGPNSAWYWNELKYVDAQFQKSSRAEVDALRLFAAFLKHGDNKAIQNKLICLSDLDTNGICNDPFLYVHDLGNTLGSDGRSVHPFDLGKWSSSKMWNDEDKNGQSRSCVAAIRINSFNGAGLSNPRISEAGRALLADRLKKLVAHPEKIKAVFEAAHMDRGNGTIDGWVNAFISRSNKIISASCPEKQEWP